jgi:RimJ/RimL family protein N-acetyltransferase
VNTGAQCQEGKRKRPEIVLRDFEPGDRDFFTSLAKDERVVRFVGDGVPWSDARIDERIRLALGGRPASEPEAVRWFIAEVEGESAALFVSSRRENAVEIGYWVAPARWGQGIAGSMLDAGLAMVVEIFDPLELEARIDPSNAVSIATVERRGFRCTDRIDGVDRYVRPIRAHEVPGPASTAITQGG